VLRFNQSQVRETSLNRILASVHLLMYFRTFKGDSHPLKINATKSSYPDINGSFINSFLTTLIVAQDFDSVLRAIKN
jgi:hypothetical protein